MPVSERILKLTGRRHTRKPPSREERLLSDLERYFPGSTWTELRPVRPGLVYVVIAGNRYDAAEIRRWASSLPEGARIIASTPRYSSANKVPMNGEAVLFSSRDGVEECPWGRDYFGKEYYRHQATVLLHLAQANGYRVKLFGEGPRIERAKGTLDYLGMSYE